MNTLDTIKNQSQKAKGSTEDGQGVPVKTSIWGQGLYLPYKTSLPFEIVQITI